MRDALYILGALALLPLIVIAAAGGSFAQPTDRARRYDEHIARVAWWRAS